jgi:Antitoxin SocA-like, Panacea domain
MNFVTVDLNESVQFDRAKLLDVVHYVCAKVPQRELGRVKLHKILYLSDMLHFAATGRPLTGVDYQKQSFGPAARQLTWALRALKDNGTLRVERRDYFGFPKLDFIVLRPVDPSRLSDDDRRLIDDVAEFACGRAAGEISDLQQDAAWESVAIGARIPYFTAFMLQPMEITEEDIAWGASEARRILAERNA